MPGQHFLGHRIIFFLDIVVHPLLEGVQVLLVNLFLNLWIIHVHAGDLFPVDINLTEQRFLQSVLEPGCQDHGVVHLAQVGEGPSFIDFLFDFGNKDLADDLGDDSVVLAAVDPGPGIVAAAGRLLHGHVVFCQHNFQTAVHNKGSAGIFVNGGAVGHDPDLVIRIHRDLRGAEFLGSLGVHPLPELLAELIFGIHERGGQLLEDVVLRQQVAAHFSRAKLVCDDLVLFMGRKVDPQVVRRGG